MKIVVLIVVMGLSSACSTAGPFVTSVSSDGNGGLVVDKCYVQMNGFTGTIHNRNCSSSKIQITQAKPATP
jgi:type IV secretion system protein VirB7